MQKANFKNKITFDVDYVKRNISPFICKHRERMLKV